MPKPIPRSYDPASLGAQCESCPLRCKGMLPVPPRVATKATALIVAECPGGQEKYSGIPFTGRASLKTEEDLTAAGLPPEHLSVFYRIACCPNPKQRIDSTLRRAANACLPRLKAELTLHSRPADFHLFLGKWAPVGVLRTHMEKHALEIKLTRNVVRNRAMVLSHPSLAYFNRPAGRAQFRTDLGRFTDVVLGRAEWPRWDEEAIFLGTSQATLDNLRAMGPVVSADVETLGTDPLVDPITAIGVSDGDRTVSFLWDSYTNRHGYHQGIADGQGGLARGLREALKDILESRTVVGHNLSYDLLAFAKLGIDITRTEDTLDAAKILDPELPGGLEEVSARYLWLPERWKTLFRAGRDDDAKGASEFSESPAEKLMAYNARDALTTALIWHKLELELAKED